MERVKLEQRAKELLESKIIDDFDYIKCQIIIDYLFDDVSYDDLVKKYYVSRATVRRALKEKAKFYFGEQIESLLTEKGKKNRDKSDKTRKYEIKQVEDVNLYNAKEILKEDILELSTKDIQIVFFAYLFLGGMTYKDISELFGICKATISNDLNSERVKELLKDKYYKKLKDRLMLLTPAPSRSISEKKEMLLQMIEYIKNTDNLSIRKMCRDLDMDFNTAKAYLNDPFYNELSNGKNK